MTELERFSKAVAFAALQHSRQTRRDGSPYIYHPLKVAELVRDAGYGVDYQIVAVLHDILEDTNAIEEEVRMFGGEIYEAIKLLTRRSGDDEDEYVAAILKNHMAAVVKNADKINNMWDAAYCNDKQWAKKYVKKAKQHYEGKFSYALDHSIGNAKAILCIVDPKKNVPCYTANEMMLNCDREKLVYANCKDLYERCINKPNLLSPNMQYWYNDSGKYYFCFENKSVWALGKAGWLPRYGNPISESEYGDELWPQSRAEVEAFINKKKNESFFYDFIDLAEL